MISQHLKISAKSLGISWHTADSFYHREIHFLCENKCLKPIRAESTFNIK